MKIKKYQEGGVAPQPAAPAEAQQDPMAQIAQLAMQAMQSQDCTAAMAVCEGILMLLEQSAQPQQAVFKTGGKMKRNCKGGMTKPMKKK